MNEIQDIIRAEARRIEEETETMLHIFPSYKDGKMDCLIMAADHEAVNQSKAGKDIDEIKFLGFHLASSEGMLGNIVIRLRGGIPISVIGVEELEDGTVRTILPSD